MALASEGEKDDRNTGDQGNSHTPLVQPHSSNDNRLSNEEEDVLEFSQDFMEQAFTEKDENVSNKETGR